MPPPFVATDPEPLDAIPVLSGWLRGILFLIAAWLVIVFAIAIWLRPYGDDGRPLRMETHRELKLPPCSFYTMTGLPCPSCGMTTSFSLLMHGDLQNSLRANAVGTLLAVFCLALIPWSLASALYARPFFIWSVDRAFMRVVIGFLVLSLARWIVILGLAWAGGPRLWTNEANPPHHSWRRSNDQTHALRLVDRSVADGAAVHRLQYHELALFHHGRR